MRTKQLHSEKGFTLIELLVVIGIIGLLASVVLVGLSGARKAGRDARRIADLHQIQAALELYYNRCGFYPGQINCGTNFTAADFAGMKTALEGSSLGSGKISQDPSGPTHGYEYGTDGTGQFYVLKAVLEDGGNKVLTDDIDIVGPSAFGNATINCVDPAYCIGVLP